MTVLPNGSSNYASGGTRLPPIITAAAAAQKIWRRFSMVNLPPEPRLELSEKSILFARCVA
jgi:hypothetical protein